ncbi:MAG TPA: B12-binding domain-containing protein [Solirubrobacterales bacterium]|nr:B12-binding domain-containing protein [Solirubrobacterales bacterium]
MSVPPSTPEEGPLVRIGELSRRTGVGVDTLRAWERRYGLLEPQRSAGGFRLYGSGDQQRVQAMKTLIDSGVSAAEAARLAAAEAPSPAPPRPGEAPADHGLRLAAAMERFDEADANAILDDAIARFTVDAVASRVLLPVLHEIGTRWESGEVSVAEEHFASALLRGRMLSLGRNWGAGAGRVALLACPPGELHDLGLIAFGLILRERGWRIAFLGSDTPIETVADAVAKLKPAAVVLAAVEPEPFEKAADPIRDLSRETPVLIGGGGASEAMAERLGARALEADPVAAAAEMSSRR